MPSGTAHSCEQVGEHIMRLHPPPVLEQNPRLQSGLQGTDRHAITPSVLSCGWCSQRSAWSRAAHPSTDDSVTPLPRRVVAAVVELGLAHDLVPGTNGIETSGEK